MKAKAIVKGLVPERYRLLRYELYERARYLPELIFSLGTRYACPFCHWQFRRFRPAGFDYPVLKEKEVTGAAYHLNDVCPRCFSNARERLLLFYLTSKTDLFRGNKSVLHIAPEPNLEDLLRHTNQKIYVTGDFSEPCVDVRLDLMQIPFCDITFDAVICNHVLEHVPNDISAMREIYRVLKPNGWAVLQVPIAMALSSTLEDPMSRTDEQRIGLFGQRDHVRLYAQQDYVERLMLVGFHVQAEEFCKELGEQHVMRYALIAEEIVFFCKKVS